jgi:hypothetical protein
MTRCHLPLAALLSLAAVLFGFPRPAAACSVCACGDSLVAIAEMPGNVGQLRLSLESETLAMTAASEASPGMTDALSQYTLRLGAVWSPLDRLNVLFTLPVTRKVMRMEGMGMDRPASDETGLGDVEVGLRWFAWEGVDFGARTRQSLALMAGASVPTGPNGAAAGGVRVDEHGQLGTGGWGPYTGLFYRLAGDVWSGFATASGRYRTRNAYGYRYGEALVWSVQAQVQPLDWLVAALGVDGRAAAADRDSGATVANTGGLVLAAAPGFHLNVVKGGWLFARAQVPFYTRLLGEQTVGPVWTAGIRYEAL